MKLTRIYIFTILLAFSNLLIKSALSAEITAVDFNGNGIGKVISTGMVINADGASIGYITADSLIMDNNNRLIGGVVPQGIAMGFDNRLLGKIHSDGIVRNMSGKTLGKALPNGLIVDDNSIILGTIIYPGLVYSASGNILGRVTGAGTYVNLDGQEIGFVSANGYAYRKTGEEYILDGRLISAKMVVSLEGDFIGSIAPSGKVIDFEGKDIGNIHANGFVYDKSGKIIGGIVQTQYAFNLAGTYMGIVSYNGEVLEGENVIARYRPDGHIVNDSGEVVGYSLSMAATVTDNQGNYLGRLVPEGNVIHGAQIVGHVGAKGYVYNQEGAKVGEIVKTGPVFDVLAHLKGQAMPNGALVSLAGSQIGKIKGRQAYDGNGTLIAASSKDMLAIDKNNKILGSSRVDSTVINGAEIQKISPFGYLLNSENRYISKSYVPAPVYGMEGMMYSYINPNGELYRLPEGAQLTSGGVLVDKNEYLGEMFAPLYALGLNNQSAGRFLQNNLIASEQGNIAYKVIPGNYVVAAKDVDSQNLTPIVGKSSENVVALSISGDLIGYADSQANVIDLNGSTYGKATFGGYVLDNNGAVAGQTVPFVAVNNDKCDVIGVVNGRGDIINNRDVLIGRLLPNGQAISDAGSYVGYASMDKELVDFDGRFAGIVNGGTAYDFQGKALGCVDRYGLVKDAGGVTRYGVINNDSVIDFDGNIVGFVLVNGGIVDNNNQIIGYIQPNGNAVSKSQKDLGQAMRYRVAYTNDNKFLGMIQSSGQVTDGKGTVVGKLNFDGSIEYNGEIIGYGLYDFYVYDENFITYGYLTKDGIVISMVGSKLGKIDKGFVVNRRGDIIARGNRDYIVRNNNNEAVGFLYLDGNVSDFNGENLGYLSELGIIRDNKGDEIAHATPLQYYVIKDDKSEDWVDTRKVKISQEDKPTKKEEQGKTSKPQNLSDRIVGIALSPDGDVIGNIYDDDSVKTQDGTQIGYRTPEGIIVDMNYNPIGIEEVKRVSAESMFVPANAFGKGNAYGIGQQPTNLGPGGGYGEGERYDPVRENALAQLQNAHRQQIVSGLQPQEKPIKISSFTGYEEDGWPGTSRTISSWRVDMSQMILEDKPIPAVLARSVYASEGFSSNIPVTAIVERNVYAEEGRNIIIPAGSRVIGSAGGSSGGNSGGAVKIGISWKRLIRPDGSQFELSSAQTADAQGRAGAIGYLDEQLLKRYTMPLLTTALESGMAYIMATGDGTTTYDTGSTSSARSQAAEDARQNFIQQMNSIFEEIMERKANIQAVTYVPAGTRIIIFPNQDLWLNSVERAVEKEEQDKNSSLNGNKGGKAEVLLRDEGDSSGSTVYNGSSYNENIRPTSAPAPQRVQPQQVNIQQPSAQTQLPPSATQQQIKTEDDDIPDLL